MKGIVYKSTGSWYHIKTEEGKFIQSRIKGIFKIDEITSTNPIAVGDEVKIENGTGETGSAMITEIFPRKNYISRTSPHNRNQQHIVASNLSQCIMFATLREPRTSLGFIDRFLVVAEAYYIPAIIVFNKADIYKKREQENFVRFEEIYQRAGYKVLLTSMQTGQGFEELKTLLKEKTTLISGHSGVGKSTFIKKVFPELELATQQVSSWSGKGMHTTTFAEMFDLPFGGSIIDTPGLKEFGIATLTRQELSHYFPEMRPLVTGCRFNNCLHLNEPGCAVIEAVKEGRVSEERYLSYCNIIESIDDKNY